MTGRDNNGRFVKGHHIGLGKSKSGVHLGFQGKHSEETKRRMSLARKGKKKSEEHKRNIGLANFKGDDAGYQAVHKWLRKYMPMPELCQLCLLAPPEDLANVTGVYTRDVDNWKYMCRSCHSKYDGVIERLTEFNRSKLTVRPTKANRSRN